MREIGPKLVIATPKNRQEKVEIVDAISSDFKQPSSKYFNRLSIDPTKLIQIGDNVNQKPFNSAN